MADLMQQARAELAVTARENMKKARALFDDNLIDAREVAGQFSDWLRVNAACQAEEFPEAAGQLSATAELIDRLAAAAQHADEWVEAHARVFRELHDLRQAQAGFVLVPVEPTREMLDAGRAAVMAEHCASPRWTPRQHYEASGRSMAGIPEDVLDERGPLTKESVAVMVFGTMLAARPQGVKDGR